MAKPVSISAKNVSAAAKATVSKALDRHKAVFPRPDYRLGFIPPYWWVGVIMDPAAELSLGNAEKVAAEVHRGIAESMPSVKGGIPGVISGNGHIIIGFAPPPDINLIEE